SGFESHLKSISAAVSRLLRLFQQQTRLQVAVLLVIRQAEVHDYFALLERKKATLNLYLTAQNTAAIASLTTSALSGTPSSTIMSSHPHSSSADPAYGSQPSSSVQSSHYRPQGREILSLPEPLHPQHSESGLIPSSLDQQQSLRQQHESSATPDLEYTGNMQSRNGRQDIYKSPFGEGLKTSHKNNESANYAFQEIGNLSSGRESTFPFMTRTKKIRGAFFTEGNKADNGAVQRLFASNDANVNAAYVANISDTGGMQNLGMDVGMDLPVHKFKKGKKWRRSTK
ncbi:MAG: hypothetical protein Q9214_004173, partial [Letrouitia sp. 1 TL-2023]